MASAFRRETAQQPKAPAVRTKPKTLTMHLFPELHRRFRVQTAEDELEMAAAVRWFIEQYLEGGELAERLRRDLRGAGK